MPMSRRGRHRRDVLAVDQDDPASAVSKPATMRSAVVLPQPDGPSSATSSPGAISMDSPSRARVARRRGSGRAAARWCRSALACPMAADGGGVPGGVGGHQSPRVSVTCDGEQGDLAATGLARLPGAEHGDGQQEEPGDEQREQRGRDRDLAAGLAVDVDPDREGLVEVQAGRW